MSDAYARLLRAENRLEAIREMGDESLLDALREASGAEAPLLAGMLHDEATARMRRGRVAASAPPEGVLVLDEEARLAYLNEGAARLFGVRAEEALGRRPMDVLDRIGADGSVAPPAGWTVSKVIAEGRAIQDEAWFRRKSDGALFSSAFAITPLTHGGRAVGAVALFRDTTLEKPPHAEPAAHLHALAALARHTPDLLLRAFPDGRVFWASPASMAVLGRAPPDLTDRTLDDLAHPDDAPHLAELTRMAREHGMPPLEAIVRLRRKNGSLAWAHVRMQAAFDEHTGRAQEIVASVRPLHPPRGLPEEPVRLPRT